MKRILVPIDGGSLSSEAMRMAFKLAEPFESEIVLLHIVVNPNPPVAVGGVWIETVGIPRDLELRGRGLLDEAAHELGAARTRSILLDAHGARVAEVIRKVAEDEQVDLIVMGTHGRSGFEKLLLGSVAEGVLRSTSAPILLVRERVAHVKAESRKKVQVAG